MKRIPKQLKQSILKNLLRSGPLTSTQLAERTKTDNEVPAVYEKNPRQMAFLMKQIVRTDDRVRMVEIGRNGKLPNGTDRYRIAFAIEEELTEEDLSIEDPEEQSKPKMKQITVNLPPECVEYLGRWKVENGLSPGRVFELLIKADIEANGQPENSAEVGSDIDEA